MANLRRPHLSSSGLQQASAPAPAARRWPWLAGAAAVLLVVLAWYDGGEEPLRPIAEDVALPEQSR